jgi:hypothetical protein
MTEPIARIEAALASLGAEHEPPLGWEARVLAAAGRPRRMLWWFSAPVALCAVLLLCLWPRAPAQLALDLALEGGPRVRGEQRVGEGYTGQILRATASGGGAHRAIRIYCNDKLVAACPASEGCRGADHIDFELRALGRYNIIALASGSPIPEPTGALDADLAALLEAGVVKELRPLTVR